MSFFDFFFPQVAQASHLRSIAETQRFDSMQAANQRFNDERERRWESARGNVLEQRVEELERDLGQAGLIIESLLQVLEEKGMLKREEIGLRAMEVDAADGAKDGRASPQAKLFLPNRKWDEAK